MWTPAPTIQRSLFHVKPRMLPQVVTLEAADRTSRYSASPGSFNHGRSWKRSIEPIHPHLFHRRIVAIIEMRRHYPQHDYHPPRDGRHSSTAVLARLSVSSKPSSHVRPDEPSRGWKAMFHVKPLASIRATDSTNAHGTPRFGTESQSREREVR